MSFKVQSETSRFGSDCWSLCCRNVWDQIQSQGEKECLDWLANFPMEKGGCMVDPKFAIFDSIYFFRYISLLKRLLLNSVLVDKFSDVIQHVVSATKTEFWIIWPMRRKISNSQWIRKFGNDYFSQFLPFALFCCIFPQLCPFWYNVFNIISKSQKWGEW